MSYGDDTSYGGHPSANRKWKLSQLPQLYAFTNIVVVVHPPERCQPPCCIHAPSDHPLNHRPMATRPDRSWLVERICEHGVGHPDPDSVAFLDRQFCGSEDFTTHGCDGCCHGTTNHQGGTTDDD